MATGPRRPSPAAVDPSSQSAVTTPIRESLRKLNGSHSTTLMLLARTYKAKGVVSIALKIVYPLGRVR